MNLRRWWDTTFAVEVMSLGLAAPILYFPARFPQPAIFLAMGLLALGWVWRRWRLGYWFQRTPADWPIFFLFFVMLPVAVWAAPQPLRAEYSWPKTYVLIWNFCLFWTVVTHAGRSRELGMLALVGFISAGMAMALVAPLGTNWLFKLPGMETLLSRLPSILGALSREGESGFHPNTIAGGLLYVLPLLMAITVAQFFNEKRGAVVWVLLAATAYMGGIFTLLQSRSGYIGLALAMLAMILIHFQWGRRAMLVGVVILLLALPFVPPDLIDLLGDMPAAAAIGGTATLSGFRLQLWTQAVNAIHDFAFTGSGLGAFQDIALLLYPLNISPGYYFGHAHNFWLQGAIDFGVPGLVAILALYMVVGVQWGHLWQGARSAGERGVATGFLGCLIAQSLYSLTDSVSMGSTPNLLFWYLFALIFAAHHLSVRPLAAQYHENGLP